ncbi:MAG TPA: translation initiation factor IF-3 [Spirochaetota bacterium]|nr:translation initiation factor IF-3 [Spirochaetota bacterium]HRZ26613.1 translation initiation factor IF-3 [Spirochaetota bacterium]
MLNRGKSSNVDKFDNYAVNEEIRSEMVRLIADGEEPRIIKTSEAIELAKAKDLDLVEISPNQDPPVVRMIDYSKFKFEQIKKAKEAKKKQKVIHVKEIKMRPSIDSHDFEHKVKHARDFLEAGDKVKFTLMFRGREMVHAELGYEVMKKIQASLEEIATVEKQPIQEGRNITMFMCLKAQSGKKTK